MRNSLMLKLMGAFLLVIAIGAVVISWLSAQATQNAFSLYTTRSGQVWAQQIAPLLADFYTTNGGWQNVGDVLNNQLSPTQIAGGSHMMGNGYRAGQGMGLGLAAGGMGGMTNPRYILTDPLGAVISDTGSDLLGKTLSAAELAMGSPIVVDGAPVGTIIVIPEDLSSATTPASQFLASVNNSILLAVLIAGALALILGAVLFLQITAPLRQLKKAANAIARGDLSQRVSIHSHDDLGELGQSFNQMADSLARAEELRRHMVADVAHELRTPIAVIQANIEGMQDGILPIDNDQIATIHSEALLLNRLVDDLRLLSLAEAGELKLERANLDLGRLVAGVVERMKPQAALKGIDLTADILPDMPEVLADSDRITQILNNLVTNALRYTGQGGSITVQARPSSSGHGVQVSVTDTGAGIDPQDLPHIFDRFYRADKSRTRLSGGSGLGLAIVKQLVEAHGGQVGVESPISQAADGRRFGTRFFFTL